jgi:hypothetical protein
MRCSIVLALIVVSGCRDTDPRATRSANGSARPHASLVALAKAPPPVKTKLFHTTMKSGPCTVEIDAPEELARDEHDEVWLTYAGALTSFTVLTDVPIESFDKNVAKYTSEDTLLYEPDRDPRIAVVRDLTAPKPVVVQGLGAEIPSDDRRFVCGFRCWGPREIEGDVVAMCSSAKIRYEPAPRP